MPKTINPIRRRILKENRIRGISARQSLLNAGYTQSTANRTSGNRSLKIIDAEILSEMDKRKIIDKAWKVYEEGLDKSKQRYTIAKDIASRDMTNKIEQKSEIIQKSNELLNKHGLNRIINDTIKNNVLSVNE